MAKIETVQEMRAFLARLPDDLTFQFLFDGSDSRCHSCTAFTTKHLKIIQSVIEQRNVI